MFGRRKFVFALALVAVSTWSFAHLCNNIYRTPDRLIVKPEKPTAVVAGTEEFRVFVQNNYPTFLNNVRLAAKPDTDSVDVAITPDSIKQMRAGERQSFTIKITAKPGAKPVKSALDFSISADNIGFKSIQPATIGDFKAVLEKEKNYSATIQAAESLVSRRDPAGIQYLTNVAGKNGPGRDYRVRAIRAIGKGGDKANIPFLRGILQESDGFIVGNALLSLGLLKDSAETFKPFLGDRDDFVRYAARAGMVLSGNGSQGYTSQLKDGLKSTNAYVRIACGWGLASKRDKAGVDQLAADFNTGDATQRVTAGDALVDVANRP